MLKITTDVTEDGLTKPSITLKPTVSQPNLNTHMSEETKPVKKPEEPSKSHQLEQTADAQV